jgi:diacylglycerol kinase family enzyme
VLAATQPLPPPPPHLQAAAADVVGATLSSGTDVQVWHMPVTFPGAPRPVRALHRTMPLRLASAAAAAAAVAAIRRSCCPPHDPGGAPRRVLAIINPASGPGGAAAIFADQVQPVLEAAGVELTVHVSQRRGHGAELVRRLAPGDADAVLAVGGDGTVFDLLQGLLQRPNWAAMRQVPVAQVPCGSGNALAASTGLWDVPTAAHAVVKGAAAPLDVASVVQPPGKRYFSFLSVTYGMIPVIDVGSEGLRWLGQSRFFVGAVREAMRQATYEVSAAYLEAPEEAEPAAGDGYDQHGGGGGAAAAEPAAAAKEGSGFEAAALGEGPPLRCGPEFAAMAGEGPQLLTPASELHALIARCAQPMIAATPTRLRRALLCLAPPSRSARGAARRAAPPRLAPPPGRPRPGLRRLQPAPPLHRLPLCAGRRARLGPPQPALHLGPRGPGAGAAVPGGQRDGRAHGHGGAAQGGGPGAGAAGRG